MTVSKGEFLAAYRPQKPWICSVVDFLMTQPSGMASIEKIAMAIDGDHSRVQAVKESIYSAVRPRCPELKGFKNDLPPIFENKEGVLRLLNFPDRPETGSEHRLRFDETHLQYALESLEGVLKAKFGDRYSVWNAKHRDEKWRAIAGNDSLRNYFANIAESNKRLFTVE